MLVIEAIANTMLVLLFLAGGLVVLNRLLQRVMENNFARIAAAEATHLDEQLKGLTEY